WMCFSQLFPSARHSTAGARCNSLHLRSSQLCHPAGSHSFCTTAPSSAPSQPPLLKTQLRKLYLKVHPDLFEEFPIERVSIASASDGMIVTLLTLRMRLVA